MRMGGARIHSVVQAVQRIARCLRHNLSAAAAWRIQGGSGGAWRGSVGSGGERSTSTGGTIYTSGSDSGGDVR